jgi:hypothetical protein
MKFARTIAAAVLGAAILIQPASARADVVLDWNAIMTSAVVGQNAFIEARVATITQLAVFEAVNAVTKKYHPYLGTVVAPPGASKQAAVIVATHDVLVTLLPATAATVTPARDAALAQIPDGQAKQDGIALGADAAAQMIAARDGDGSFPPQFYPPAPPAPGVWQATPLCSPAGGVFFHLPNVTPFGLERADQFRSGPPPALTSLRYARDYIESKILGRVDSRFRPQDRSDVALYYGRVLGVQTWNPAVRQVAAAQGHSMTYNARALALVNIAVVDGLIAVMDTKYTYTWWRPETAIKGGNTDGNPWTLADPLWAPFINVPCHPDYPSAHATLAGGARELAERLFGSHGHSITLQHTLVPGIVLHYTRFKDIARDIDDARIYGGVHFRYDQEQGARMGKKVGTHLYKNVLRPIHHFADDDEVGETDSRE